MSICQNHRARVKPHEVILAMQIVMKYGKAVLKKRAYRDSLYYNEPTIWYEFVYETAKLAKEKNLKNVLVTNGYICKEPLDRLLPYIDAMNIDLKAYNNKFYKELVKGGLEEVKSTISESVKHCHVEITTLLFQDAMIQLKRWRIWQSGFHQCPGHSAAPFQVFPNYEMADRPPTPRDTLAILKQAAERHLKYVYLGNV